MNSQGSETRSIASVVPQFVTPSWMTLVFASLVLIALSMNSTAQVQFEDVSDEVGLTGFTESWGANFGDLNGDNCLDIFVQGHRDYPRVYRNTCTGVFEDIATQMDDGTWMAKPQDDKHGAAFGDFDNDGDEDIILSVSVSGPGQLWVNQGNGVFSELASMFGVTSDFAARQSGWMDFNNDGLLDTLQMGLSPRSYARYQTPTGTFSSSINTDHQCDEGDIGFFQLLDITADGRLEMVCVERGSFPFRAYDTGSLPFLDVTDQLPSFGNVNGVLMGDFDGNLRTDVLMTRGATRPAGAVRVNNTRIEAWIEKDPGDPPRTGFVFQSAGAITVTNWSRDLSRNAPPHVMNLAFGASQQCSDGSEYRVCAEYNAGQNRWEVFMGGDGGQAYIIVETNAAVSGLQNVGENNRDRPIAPRLYLNTAGGFNFATGGELSLPVNCGGGAAADFDNDMDLDLYLSCGRGPENLANRMYINQGDGSFVLQQGTTGAEGPMGVGFDIGVAENTIFGDYDLDGFVDLFVTNGLLYYPWGLGGPDILMRNLGNSNHWVQIDLQGVTSNMDGIGAKVYVTAGGVQQLREQNGGYNRWGQNQQWLHFGLAGNTTADIRIEWPSGAVDNHTAVDVDELYTAVEGGGLTAQTQGTPISTVISPGEECGEPAYDFNFGPANLLWRDCGTNNWHFRSKGGRADLPQLATIGTIVADAEFSGVVGFDLNGSDSVDNSTPEEIAFDIRVNGINDQGFDFNIDGQTSSCLDFSREDFDDLLIGAGSKQVDTPLDLLTMWPCGQTPPPEISIANASAEEDLGVIEFEVSLSETSALPVQFRVSTQDVTAQQLNGDYTRLSSAPYVIPAGSMSTTVSVAIGVDLSAEINEEFVVSLSNVANARVVGGTATGTIINDDGALPQLSVSDAAAFEDTGAVDFVVSLNTPAVEDISFVVLTAGQTASYLSDYTAIISETFIIPAGEIDLTITIALGIDEEIEDDEVLFVGLSNFSTNVDPIDTLGVITILDDDAPSSAELSIADAMIDEDAGTLSFNVMLSATDAADVTFDVSTSDGSATTADLDYTPLVNVPHVIQAGLQSTTVSVSLGVDATPEADETFTVTLSNVSPNAELIGAIAIGTILDDDTLPELTIIDSFADEDAGTISFTVELNTVAVGEVTFQANTADGSATAGEDYTALTNVAGSIAEGVLQTTVVVTLIADTEVEGNEDFTVSLTNVSTNVTPVDTVATGTINNDDVLPELTIIDSFADEDTGTMSFTVELNTAAVGEVNFLASTADGTAVAGADYTALTNVAGSIAEGVLQTTVVVTLIADTEVEGNEDFTVSLTSVSTNVTPVDTVATGTINNDDAAPPDLTIIDSFADEDTGTMSFTVQLGDAAVGDVNFLASTADGTAVAGEDYTALTNVAGSIAEGVLQTTVVVTLIADTEVEGNEDFTVSLTSISTNVTPVDTVATGMINNDDITLPTLSIEDAAADEDSGSIDFVVSLSAPATTEITFDATTTDGTATTADSDYTSLSSAAGSIGIGEMQTTVTVILTADSVFESDEDFTVTLANISANAVPIDVEATGTIRNDDALPELSIADASADEDTGVLSFTVSLDKAAVGDVTFGTTTVDGTATVAGADYSELIDQLGTITSGTLSTTVEVALGVDTDVESDEIFTVTLANVTTNVTLLDGVATGTILNDDVPAGPTIVDIDSWLGQEGGVSTAGNRVTFDGSGPSNWVSAAYSAPLSDFGFTDEYEVRFTIIGDPSNTIWVAGLGITEGGSDFRDIDYGLRSSNGQFTVYENGTWRTSDGSLADGDVVSIYVSAGSIEYRVNGTPVFSSTYSGSPSFYVDTAFKSGAIALDVVAEGNPGPVDPPDNSQITAWVGAAGGVSAAGNNLSFSGSPNNWTNTINSASMSSLGAGSAYTVSWVVDSNPNNTIWVVGLGINETDSQRTDIEYGFRNSNGSLQVRQNGNWLANISALSVGDMLGIRVDGTMLEFQLNGVPVYTSVISGTEDFYIDTAFKSGAIELGSFTLSQ